MDMDMDMDMYMYESEIMIPFPPVLNPYLLAAYPSKLYAHHSFGFGAVPSLMSTETHRAIAEGVLYEIKNSFENPIYLFSSLIYHTLYKCIEILQNSQQRRILLRSRVCKK